MEKIILTCAVLPWRQTRWGV